MGKHAHALQAIQEAVKHSRHNWKVWDNYLTLALHMQKWGLVLNALDNMLDLKIGLGRRQKKSKDELKGDIDAQALFMVSHAALQTERDSRLRKQLESFYKRMKQECSIAGDAWKVIGYYHRESGGASRGAGVRDEALPCARDGRVVAPQERH